MSVLERHQTKPVRHWANVVIDDARHRPMRKVVDARHINGITAGYLPIAFEERPRMVWYGGHVRYDVFETDHAGLLDRLGKKIRLRHGTDTFQAASSPLDLSFSDRTLGLVQEGIVDTVAMVQDVPVEEMFDGRMSNARVAEYLGDSLLLALISLADVFRQFGLRSTELTGPDGFLPNVDRYLFQTIPVSTKSFGTFSRYLREDLMKHLYSGGTLSGAWGGLGHRDGKLVLNVEGEPSVMPPIGSRPTVYFDD